jgi:prephenate dehydratase
VPQDHPLERLEGRGRGRYGRRRQDGGKEKGDRSMAALAPRLAADLYGLEILAENVEDRDDNVTRFVVLSREEKWVQRNDPDEVLITTFVFNVRNIPAALYKAMGGFATNGINMTKLESYQLGGKFVATQFYADIEGHPDDAPRAPGDGRTAVLLGKGAGSRHV